MIRQDRLLVLLCFGAVYFVWGSTYLALRYAVETLPPYLLAGARFLAAGGALGLLAWRKDPRFPGLGEWRRSGLIGMLMIAGGAGSVTWASRRVPSGICALLVATIPMWMVLLQWLFVREEKVTSRMLLGIGLGFLGTGSLVMKRSSDGTPAIDPVGAVVLLAAALSWALGSLMSRREMTVRHPLWAVAMKMLVGGGFLLGAGLLRGELGELDLDAVPVRSVVALFYLTVFGTGLTFTAYVWLLRRVPPARVATYAYVNPVVAVLLGWLVADEVLTGAAVAAAAIIVLSVVIVNTAPRRKATQVGADVPPTRRRRLLRAA